MRKEQKHHVQSVVPPLPESASQEPGKQKKRGTLLETMREIDAKEAKREAEAEERRQELIAEQEKQEKERYSKQIQQERIELIRLKQGIVEESDLIGVQHQEQPKRSIWKRLFNFFYHNKWWIIIVGFISAVFLYLGVDYFTQIKPDMIVMMLTDDAELQNCVPQLEEYLEQFTDDENHDGKVHVDIYPIPVTDTIGEMDYYTGNATKLYTQMQLGDSVLILTDAKANEYIAADQTLLDLEQEYPGHDNLRGNGYYLRHSDFAAKIGCSGTVDRDLSFGLRAVKKTLDSKKEMQENYDIAAKVLERIMADLDNTPEPEELPAETTVSTPKED